MKDHRWTLGVSQYRVREQTRVTVWLYVANVKQKHAPRTSAGAHQSGRHHAFMCACDQCQPDNKQYPANGSMEHQKSYLKKTGGELPCGFRAQDKGKKAGAGGMDKSSVLAGDTHKVALPGPGTGRPRKLLSLTAQKALLYYTVRCMRMQRRGEIDGERTGTELREVPKAS